MDARTLETFIFDKMAETKLPGLSLALVEGGELSYARGFGQRDLERGLPATPETLYCVGSVTKSVTAVAVLQLAERGKLSLEDPVSRYVPWPLPERGEPVRLHHLLTHTSGLPALAYGEALFRHAHGLGGRSLPIGGPEDILTFMTGADGWAECTPGERWFYLNEGYAILGLIVQRVSGKPYHDYVRDEILRPLEMTRSTFSKEAVDADADTAVPYVLQGETRPGRYLYRTIRSEGGLISSVADLSRYLKMFLSGGRGVLSDTSLQEMMTPRVEVPMRDAGLFGTVSETVSKPDLFYGYGVQITEDFFGERLVGHGGSVLVSTAHLAFVPERGVGVAVLANGSGYPLSQIAQVAVALALGEDPGALPFRRLERAFERLTGRYEAYRGTVWARLEPQADFLVVRGLQAQDVLLVPEDLSGPEYRFSTLAGGRRLEVTFHERDGVELILERYKLRRVGPL